MIYIGFLVRSLFIKNAAGNVGKLLPKEKNGLRRHIPFFEIAMGSLLLTLAMQVQWLALLLYVLIAIVGTGAFINMLGSYIQKTA